MSRLARLSLLCLIGASGCSDDAIVPPDAAADSGEDTATPRAFELALTPCPEGWRETLDEGVTVCEPWSTAGRADCPDGEAHFPGEPGCAPLGTVCPTGPFPDDAPIGAIFVDAAATSGGDGSRTSPYASLENALAVATFGAVVQLSTGTHMQRSFTMLMLPTGVTLRGACAGGTRIAFSELGAIIASAGSTIANLTTVTGGIFSFADEGAPGELTIEGVEVIGNDEDRSLAGQLDLTTSTRLSRLRLRSGAAILVDGSGPISIDRVSVEGPARGIAVTANGDGSAVSISRVALIDTHSWGLFVLSSAGEVSVREVVVEGGSSFGIGVGALDLTASDILIRDIEAEGGFGADGLGLFLDTRPELPTQADLQRVRIERVRDAALLVQGPVTTNVEKVLIRDVAREACESGCPDASRGGSGIAAARGAQVTLEDFVVRRAVLCGLHIDGTSAMDARLGEVSECTAGACIGAAMFEISRLSDRVVYRDNGTNLESETLPVPSIDPPSGL